uniref:Uncharacterized protein n=1 Tax=Parascaris univalens TaxID=6257 RepID=A0A915BIF5_PARUN
MDANPSRICEIAKNDDDEKKLNVARTVSVSVMHGRVRTEKRITPMEEVVPTTSTIVWYGDQERTTTMTVTVGCGGCRPPCIV